LSLFSKKIAQFSTPLPPHLNCDKAKLAGRMLIRKCQELAKIRKFRLKSDESWLFNQFTFGRAVDDRVSSIGHQGF